MFPNIRAEMARKGLTIAVMASGLQINERTLGNKLLGKTDFTWNEVCQIREKYFPSCSFEYLFKPGHQDQKEFNEL